jgi:hypothetical protein
MFGGVNENFAAAAVDGALAMAGDSVDLWAMQDAVVPSGANILPVVRDVQRAACTVVKNWWRSFAYNYVMAAIHAKHEKVFAHL